MDPPRFPAQPASSHHPTRKATPSSLSVTIQSVDTRGSGDGSIQGFTEQGWPIRRITQAELRLPTPRRRQGQTRLLSAAGTPSSSGGIRSETRSSSQLSLPAAVNSIAFSAALPSSVCSLLFPESSFVDWSTSYGTLCIHLLPLPRRFNDSQSLRLLQ